MYALLNCEDHLEVIVMCNLVGVSNLLCVLEYLGGGVSATRMHEA